MSYNPPGPEWQNQGSQQGGWGNQPPQDGWQQPQEGVPFGQLPNSFGHQLYPEQSQAGLALGLGIGALVSMCVCQIFAPFLGGAAWYFGHLEKRAIAQGLRHPSGHGQANTGMIMGIVSTVLTVGFLLIWLVAVLASAAAGA